MNPDKLLCTCKRVSQGDVLKAMRKGARKYKEVRETTGAGSKCGKCEKDIRKFMRKHRPED